MFKDTYSIISTKLKLFPQMFNLDSGVKEVFPYDYYNASRAFEKPYTGIISDALDCIKEQDRESFITNVNNIAHIDGVKFDMKAYAVFYCKQDVNILVQGFEYFRTSLINEFNLDAYDFVSISSIANKYMEINCYYPNGNLYDLSNTPREFISRCIIGGRCMLADNKPSISDSTPIALARVSSAVVDFDAVSLYPSAMARLYTLEGIPHVLQSHQLSQSYLMEHLFDDEQFTPTESKFISGFFIEAEITSVGLARHFPLVT